METVNQRQSGKGLIWYVGLLFIILIFLTSALILLIVRQNSRQGSLPNNNLEIEREYAALLHSQGLYGHAIDAYQRYLALAHLPVDKEASIHYLIANISMEKLNNYEKAMAEYLWIKQLVPQSTLMPEVNRKIVACLEHLNRSLDAQRTLTNTTALKKEAKEKTEAVNIVAKIGERVITLQDLNDEIQKLPPALQKTYSDGQEKLQFLKQFIAKEILYDTARRRRYDQDPSISQDLESIKKELIIQRLMTEELGAYIQPSEEEIHLYYQANRERYTPGQTDLASVKSQVEQDLRQQKEQAGYQELLKKALKAQQVEIFDYYLTNQAKDKP